MNDGWSIGGDVGGRSLLLLIFENVFWGFDISSRRRTSPPRHPPPLQFAPAVPSRILSLLLKKNKQDGGKKIEFYGPRANFFHPEIECTIPSKVL